jgi:hypothetical protein
MQWHKDLKLKDAKVRDRLTRGMFARYRIATREKESSHYKNL